MSANKDLDQSVSIDRGAELRERWWGYAKKGGGYALRGAGVVLGAGLVLFGAAEVGWAVIDEFGLLAMGSLAPIHEAAQFVRDGLSPEWAGTVGDFVGSAVGGLVEVVGDAHTWLLEQTGNVAAAAVTDVMLGTVGAAGVDIGLLVARESLDG